MTESSRMTLLKSAPKRVKEILDNTKKATDVHIEIDGSCIGEQVPTITYTITELLVGPVTTEEEL